MSNTLKQKAVKTEEWDELSPTDRLEFWQGHTVTKGQYHHGFAIQGWRESMEDTMDVKSSLAPFIPNMFGVYDGHGGSDCAKFCRTHLLQNLSKREDLLTGTKMALADSFISIDSEYRDKFPENDDGATATTVLVLPVDAEVQNLTVVKQNIQRKGSKIKKLPTKEFNASVKNSAVFKTKERKFRIFCACVGDSRALVVHKNGNTTQLSFDHNLERQDEYDRVVKGNGVIRVDPQFNEKLVYNNEEDTGLNVTRTIGDKFFKPIVTAFPEVHDCLIGPDAAYLIVASDGLWSKVDNDEVARVINEYGLTKGLKNLAHLSNKREIFDNCTLIGVDLQRLVRTINKTLNEQTPE